MTDIPSPEQAASGRCPSWTPDVAEPRDKALAIPCTLGAGDLRQRTARIRDLATRHLRTSARRG